MGSDSEQKSISASRGRVLRMIPVGLAITVAYFALLKPQFADWLSIDQSLAADAGYRLRYSLRWLCLPAMTLFVSVMSVGFTRMFSQAIDIKKSTPALEVFRNVLQNTLEQTVLLTLNLLALSQNVGADNLVLVPMVAVQFVLARIIFALGYWTDPINRAIGFAATITVNMAMAVYNLSCLLTAAA